MSFKWRKVFSKRIGVAEGELRYRCLDDEMMPGPFIIGEFTGVIDNVGIVGDDTPGSPNLSCSLVAPPGDSGSPPGDCDDVPCGDTNLDGTTNVLVSACGDALVLRTAPVFDGLASVKHVGCGRDGQCDFGEYPSAGRMRLRCNRR